jgi:hypothetical protein
MGRTRECLAEPVAQQGVPKEDELFTQIAHYLLMNTYFIGLRNGKQREARK